MDGNGMNIPKTDEEISAELKKLQRKNTLGKIMILVGFPGIIAFFMLDQPIIALVCIAVLAVGAFFAKKSGDAIKQTAGSGILEGVLGEVFEEVDYKPFERLSGSLIDSADFQFSYDEIEGNDYVKAKYKGLNIEMSDIQLIDISYSTDSDGHTQETRSTVFKGMWLVCDFGKELTADVRVCERTKLGKMLGKGGIKTENEAFNKQFNIRSENAEEAFYILTPHMMEYIVQMDEKAKARTYLSFLRSGKLHVALDSGKDAFEIKGRMSDATKIREQFTQEIRYVTDLIDELRIADNVFKA